MSAADTSASEGYLDRCPAATSLGQCRFAAALEATAEATRGPALLIAAIAAWHLGREAESADHAARWLAAQGVPSAGPLVSIIIPTRDRRELLRRALASVEAQLYRPLEVIVVNDAGEDVDDLLPASRADLRWQIVHSRENVYLAQARNLGLQRARGRWVLCLDDDDLLYPHHVAQLVALAGERHDVVVGLSLLHRRGGAGDETLSAWSPQPFSVAALSRQNVAPVQAVLFRRSLTARAGGFDRSLLAFEDWDFWLRVAAVARGVGQSAVPSSCVDYRHQAARLSAGLAVALQAYEQLELRHGFAAQGATLAAHHQAARAELRAAAVAELLRVRRVGLVVLQTDPPATGWAPQVAAALAPLRPDEELALPSDARRHAWALQRLLGRSGADYLAIVDSRAAACLPAGVFAELALALEARPGAGVARVDPTARPGVDDASVALGPGGLLVERRAAAAVDARTWRQQGSVAEQWRALLAGIESGWRNAATTEPLGPQGVRAVGLGSRRIAAGPL